MNTMLTVLGALGGVVIIYAIIIRVVRALQVRRAARDAISKDYYYRSIELTCRCEVPGKVLHSSREAEIVSCQDDLSHIRVGFGPASVATFVPQLSPSSLTLRPVDAHLPSEIGDWTNYRIEFGRKLKKREAIRFKVELTTTALEGKVIPSFWSWVSEHRVDSLVLRVAFAGDCPTNARFRTFDQEGDVHAEEQLVIDPLSRECRKAISFPRPRFQYLIQWEPADPSGKEAASEPLVDSPSV